MQQDIQYENFEDLDACFVKLNEFVEQVENSEKFKEEVVKCLEDKMQEINIKFDEVVSSKFNWRFKLKDDKCSQDLKKYCEVLNKKFKSI